MARLARSLSLAVVLVVGAGPAWAGPLVGLQGRLLGADALPESGVIAIGFALYDQAEGATAIHTEPLDVAVSDGFWAVFLGTEVDLDAGLFDGRDLWVGVSVEGEAEMLPRMRIGSVPYAIRAKGAGGVDGLVNAIGGVKVEGTLVIDAAGKWVGPGIDAFDAESLTAFLQDHGMVTHDALAGYVTSTDMADVARQADLAPFARTDDLADVAFSGAFGDLLGIPDGLADGDDVGTLATGTTGHLARFTNPSTLGDSAIVESSGKVGIGVAQPAAPLHVGGLVIVGDSDSCTDTTEGAIRYYKANQTMQFCDGITWRAFSYSNPPGKKSCLAWKTSGATTDGIYKLDPDGAAGPIASFDAFCDMTTEDGGWTLVAALGPSGYGQAQYGGTMTDGATTTKPQARTVPPANEVWKFADTVINAIKDTAATAPGIRYETTAGKKYSRGSCVWRSLTALTSTDTACLSIILTYATNPTWTAGNTSNGLGGCPGSGIGLTGPAGCRAGTDNMAFLLLECGSRTDNHFHRHWCGDGPSGYLWVR